MAAKFRDRVDAGRQLAAKLSNYAGRAAIVLALPRGGLPVGYEVAREIGATLDVFLVRKVGLPGHEEFAMGAIASGGTVLINEDVTRTYRISEERVAAAIHDELQELERREREYRGSRPFPDLRGRVVIVVDDGLATGSSMKAAVTAIRRHEPAELIVAVPIAPAETCAALRRDVDEVVCAVTPEPFYAVGLWYERFEQMTDEEVREILDRAGRDLPAA